MRTDGQLARQITIAENLDSLYRAIRQAGIANRGFIHASAILELIEIVKIDRHVIRRMARVVESALGDTTNQRHLATLEADANRAARAGCLAFATATAGFAVPAGFALAEALAAMLGAGARF